MPTDRPDAPAGALTIDSPVLGALTLDADALYTFPLGLVGMEAARRFAVLDAERPGFSWLQSVDDPALVFVVADPFAVIPGYAVDIPDAELAPLGPATPADLLVLVIVTLGAGGAATANLRAPLVLNVATRQGRQVVLADDRLSITEPLAL